MEERIRMNDKHVVWRKILATQVMPLNYTCSYIYPLCVDDDKSSVIQSIFHSFSPISSSELTISSMDQMTSVKKMFIHLHQIWDE